MLVSQREGEGASHRREIIQFSEIQNLMFMQEAVWFRVNFAKFNVHIRNTVRPFSKQGLKDTYRGVQLIESSVKARYNDIAGSVMAAILSGTEKHQLSLSERRSGTHQAASLSHDSRLG